MKLRDLLRHLALHECRMLRVVRLKKRITKLSTLIVITVASLSAVYSQEVTVKATTNKKEIATILRKASEASRINQAFFSEHDRCRGFLKAQRWSKAESSCRLGVSFAEKLPREHVLERSGIRASLAIALLWQQRPWEAIGLLNKSVELRNTVSNDSDADTGDLYFLLGQAYSLLNDIENARSYYERAERTYRAAFVEIGDEWLRGSYSRRLQNAVETHYNLVTSAGLVTEAEKLRVRLAEVEKDFAKYLKEKADN